MLRISHWIWWVVSGIFVIISLIIFNGAWFWPGKALSVSEMAYRKEFFNFFDSVTNLLLTLILIIFLISLLYWLNKLERKKLFTTLIIGCSLLLQLYLAFNFKGSQGIDDFDVRQQAAFLAAGSHQWSTYFYFGPNSGAAIFFALVYQFSRIIGLGYNTVITNLAVMILLDLAVWSGWLILKRHEKANAQESYLLLCTIFIPLYLTSLFTYTDPLALSFLMFGFSCLDAIWNKKQPVTKAWQKYLLLIGTGVFLALAVYLKTNTAIAVIAVLIFIFFNRKSLKKNFLLLAAFLMVFAITTQATSVFQKNVYHFKVVKNESFPYSYWIAMGLNPKSEGSSVGAWPDIAKYHTYQGRSKHTQKLIKQRLKQMGFSGLLDLYRKKINSQWTLGTVGTEMRNYGLTAEVPQSYSNFFGNQRAPLQEIQQIVYLTVWLLALTEGIFCFRRTQKQIGQIQYLLMLYIIGVFLFHTLMWEVMPRYAFITVIPLIMLAAQGVTDINDWLDVHRLNNRGYKLFGLVNLLLLAGIIWGSFNNLHYTKTIVRANEPVISQQFFRQEALQLQPKQQISEEFFLPRAASLIQTSVLPYPQKGLTLKIANRTRQVKIKNYQNGTEPIKQLPTGNYQLTLKNESQVPIKINYFEVEPLDILQQPISGFTKRYLSFALMSPVKNAIYPSISYWLIFLIALAMGGLNAVYLLKKIN
ncbi:hypothetical protein [Liquorilactobacillus nagelii]|uniref:hypothetical protein n=2 Tax=Liquorilactobacillus nagelii TaxID=82688 RepID=UPI001CC8FC2C|nr:hypothetical protein [Liquorilactobacillus nagelii]ULQ50105.1 hypothetical protein J6864_03520 [Liquorilactobacillus nagelii]